MLRVGIPPTDPISVYNVRTRWAADVLAAAGEIEIVELPEELDILETYGSPTELPKIKQIKNFPEMDLLILTRVLSQRLAQIIPFAQAKGTKVIVDIDDDMRHLPPTNADFAKVNPNLNPRYNINIQSMACKLADWVTCATPALMYYAPGRSTVIPNCIPESYLDIKMDRHCIKTVGWSGAVSYHPNDLDVTHGGVAQALEAENARLFVVGDPHGVGQKLGIPEPTGSGIISHERYPFQIATLDAGIVPLADTKFNEAKSWITPLTMSAVGVPWVGSPTFQYQMLFTEIERATGDVSAHLRPAAAIANARSREWKREILGHLRQPQDERELALEIAKGCVRNFHTVGKNADRWLDAWKKILSKRSEIYV